MIRTDKVAVLEVEAVELVAGLLRIHYVFIDNESSALGIGRNALADLAVGAISIGDRERLHAGRAYRIGPNLPKRSNNSSGVTL